MNLAAVDHIVAHQKLGELRALLGELGCVTVAYSGGVDSAFLLRVARDVLGQSAQAIIGVSPSLMPEELSEAHELAGRLGVPLREIETGEMENPDYASNPVNRCYFCKSTLFQILNALAAREAGSTIIDGTNADDVREWRPGAQAGIEQGVRSPLREVALDKAEIRLLSREMGLPTWDKPAMPCLSSRIPYGTPVTREALRMIGRAEAFLRGRGLREVRVRHHVENDKPTARLEIAPEELPKIFDFYEESTRELKAIGYTVVLLDLEGYRRGRLNEGVTPGSPTSQPVTLFLKEKITFPESE